MSLDRSLKTSFGNISKLYDTIRPSYPDELIKDIIKVSKIKNNSRILDIGCGSGKATILFTNRGYKNILGLDISKELIEIAKNNLPLEINYIIDSFEDYQFKENFFDLIISAQAFHWLDQKLAYKKCYEILKPNGTLTLFWNFPDYNKNKLMRSILSLSKKYCPKFPEDISDTEKYISRLKPHFKSINIRKYTMTLSYSKKEYLNLINTFSWVSSLDEEKKAELFKEINLVFNKVKEPIKRTYNSTLIIVRK